MLRVSLNIKSFILKGMRLFGPVTCKREERNSYEKLRGEPAWKA